MNSEFGYQAGMLDNGTLTTRPPSDYGLTQSQYYMKPNGSLSGGNFRGILGVPSTYQMHISPNVTFGNIVDFRAIAGHELIHAIHASVLGNVGKWSEAAAYKYSNNVFMNAGRFNDIRYLSTPLYPSNYDVYRLFRFWY
jgi:hypothetical protein